MANDFQTSVEKTLRDADRALTRIAKSLNKLVLLDKQGKFTEKKAKATMKKAVAAIKARSAVGKLPAVKGFDGLPEEVRLRGLRMARMVDDLLGREERIVKVIKLMRRDPERDAKILNKQAKDLSVQIGAAPKHVAVLVREAKGGFGPESRNFERLNTVPILLMLWLMVETLQAGLA